MKNSNLNLKKETESLKLGKEANNNKTFNILSDISKNIKKEQKIGKIRTLINLVFCLFIFVLAYFVINNYEEKWKIAYYLTLWSFFMNSFYVVSVTAIDITRIIKNYEYCVIYNNFIRKHFLRICFPFALSIIVLFWILILLGDDFQFNSRTLFDYLVNFCFHGLQIFFYYLIL